MTGPDSVVIVGESLAGLTAAGELRRLGYQGRLTLIGDEPRAAYSRPPLSKQVLWDARSDHTLTLPSGDLGCEVRRCAATGLDPARKVIHLATGATVRYDAAVIATGASARRLAQPGQRGELVLRTVEDAIRLRSRLDTARSACVVGAGFLGMEVASACVRRGIPVTVVDTEPPLRRLLGPFLSDLMLERLHTAGVSVRISPATLTGDPARGVRFADGSVVNADVIVTCAGDIPNTDWLADAGLAVDGGVVIDHGSRTSIPDVYAAGDVACVRTPTGPIRRPFWSNAAAQGRLAAHAALGSAVLPPTFDNYFWSTILGISIKVVGELPLGGAPEIVEGSLTEHAVLRWSRADGNTVVAWGLNRPLPRLRALAAEVPHRSSRVVRQRAAQ